MGNLEMALKNWFHVTYVGYQRRRAISKKVFVVYLPIERHESCNPRHGRQGGCSPPREYKRMSGLVDVSRPLGKKRRTTGQGLYGAMAPQSKFRVSLQNMLYKLTGCNRSFY